MGKLGTEPKYLVGWAAMRWK